MSDLLNKMPLVYEPKRKNRWIMRFPSDLGIQEWTLASSSRPTYKSNSVDIDFLNTKTYVAGKYEWAQIDVSLRDAIGPSTTQAIMEWVRLHSESATGRQGYAAGYMRDVELFMLDPTGVTVEKWLIKNAFIISANFGNLDMSQDGIADVTISLRPSHCLLCY